MYLLLILPHTILLLLDPGALTLPVMPDGADVAVHVLTVCPPLFELGVKLTLIARRTHDTDTANGGL